MGVANFKPPHKFPLRVCYLADVKCLFSRVAVLNRESERFLFNDKIVMHMG